MANTPNYDLPLLNTSNIPSWLVGWNQAMNTIDLALDGLQEQIDGATGEPITVDSEFSETSENPVQNKVITAYLNQLTARVAALEKGSEIKITTQPVNVSAYKGQSFTFSITAESQLPLSYRWYFKGSADTEFTETNTTTNTYTATATSDSIGAIFEYKCKVSNGLLEVWSDVATLTIVTQPTQVTATINQFNINQISISYTITPSIDLPYSAILQTRIGTASWVNLVNVNGTSNTGGSIANANTGAFNNARIAILKDGQYYYSNIVSS